MSRFVCCLITILMVLTACDNALPDETDEYKIGVARFTHETCTFCPRETGIAEFEYYGPPLQGEEVLASGNYVSGFVDRVTEYGSAEIIGLRSPRRAVGGSAGSWISLEAFEKYTNGIIDDIARVGPFDGIYLPLHGAMAVRGIPKPEAEIARRIREVTGDIPIIITLDLHANVDHELSDAASGVLIIKRYPHYDSYRQGERAGRLMMNVLGGDYHPVMSTRKPGIITPSVYQGTGVSPAMEIMERARRWEDREPGSYVSVAFGFAYADVPDVGATIMVITNNDQELADKISSDMNDYIWRMREAFAGKVLPKTQEGVRLSIEAAKQGKTPVVISDQSDRTGNSTHILEELIRQGAENFCIATIADKKLIEQLGASNYNTGEEISVDVGGYADEFAGNPVKLDAVLEYFDSYGRAERVAVLKFGKNNRVIITPELNQVTSAGILESLNIDLNEIDIISLKSKVGSSSDAGRGFYGDALAGAIFEVDAPGLGPADLTLIEYQNIPEDIYPLNRK